MVGKKLAVNSSDLVINVHVKETQTTNDQKAPAEDFMPADEETAIAEETSVAAEEPGQASFDQNVLTRTKSLMKVTLMKATSMHNGWMSWKMMSWRMTYSKIVFDVDSKRTCGTKSSHCHFCSCRPLTMRLLLQGTYIFVEEDYNQMEAYLRDKLSL